MTARPLSVAVVGLGFGANHARVLHEMPSVRLAAVCDRNPARLAAAAAGRDLRCYSDIETLLSQETLDALVVAVPAHLHAAIALPAIAAGCAVLIEKPLAPSLAEGRLLVEAAARAGVVLMPGHIERCNPAVQELARRVQAGEAGRVIQLTARRLAYFAGRSRDVDVGVIHDLAYHEIDVMRLLAGSEVDRVFAEVQSNVLTPFDDAVGGLLRFQSQAGAAGAVGSLEVHWLSTRKVRELTVLGDRGNFLLDYQAQTLTFQQAQTLVRDEADGVSLAGADPGPLVALPVTPREPLLAELEAFVASVRDGTPPPATGQDALAALAIADALLESARTGLPVVPARE